MCCPTVSAVAVTLENVLGLRASHVSTLHTWNVRTLPEATGVTRAGARGGARTGRGGAVFTSSRSARRSRRSNSCATLGTEAAAGTARGGAASALPPNLNACESSGVLLADWAITRYATLAEPDGSAGNTAHPAVWVGSTVVYAATPMFTCPPLVAVHGASGFGPGAALELQAAARNDDTPTAHRPFGIA